MNRPPDIAVVGMSCIFPKAKNLETYWNNIVNKVDAITVAPEHRISPHYFDPSINRIDRHYTNMGGFIDEYLDFDPIAFGIVPNTIPETEPEQFISLRMAHEALEDAGVFKKNIPLERSGIVIGKGNYVGPVSLKLIDTITGTGYLRRVLEHARPDFSKSDLDRICGAYQQKTANFGPHNAIGNTPSLVAAIVANRFNFSGPAYTIDAACASSLIAVDHCVKELQLGRSDMMIAGSIHISQAPELWSVFCTLGAFSKTHKVRPFDRKADGVLAGEGVGFVVLRRLEDAIKDDQRIYAVIKGVGISSDGSNASLMSPAWQGQTKAVKRAWEQTELSQDQIGYIEAHGTATVLGDKTELKTLATCFPKKAGRAIAGMGSVKSMIGHAMPAAGMAGFIKTALALHHDTLPPTLHCDEPHEDMETTGFNPVQNPIKWSDTDLPLVAGVNAFGFGGANSHAILEKFNTRHKTKNKGHHFSKKSSSNALLLLARPSQKALIKALREKEESLGQGPYRIALFNPSDERREKALKIVGRNKEWKGKQDIWYTKSPLLKEKGKIAFIFPGLDSIGLDSLSVSNHRGLAQALNLTLSPLLENLSLDSVETLKTLDHSYRLVYDALIALKIMPDVVSGHSMGEWSAGTCVGMTDIKGLEEVEQAISDAKFEKPDYVFHAACCGFALVDELIAESDGQLFLSNDNCPNQVVLSCKVEYQPQLKGQLDDLGIVNFSLPFSTGYHSPYGKVYQKTVKDNASKVLDIRNVSVPLWSCITAAPYPKTQEAVEKLYEDFVVSPVRFRELIENLYKDGVRVFIQVGAGATTGFINDILKEKPSAVVAASSRSRSILEQLKRVLAALFIEGRGPEVDFMELLSPKELVSKEKEKKKGMRVMLDIGYNKVDPANIFTDQDLQLPSKQLNPEHLQEKLGYRADTSNSLVQQFDKVTSSVVASQQEVLAALHVDSELQIAKYLHTPQVAPPPTGPIDGRSDFLTDFEFQLDVSLEKYPTLTDHEPLKKRSKHSPFSEDLEPVIPLTMFVELGYEIVSGRIRDFNKVVVRIEHIVVRQFVHSLPGEQTKIKVKGVWKGEKHIHLSMAEGVEMDVFIGEGFPNGELPKEVEPHKTSPIVASEIYRKLYLFHGPAYQGIKRIHVYGKKGMKTTIEAPGGKGALLDSALQSTSLWHHFEEKNLMGFPVGIAKIIFHADLAAQTGEFTIRTRHNSIEGEFLFDDVFMEQNGKAWCSIFGLKIRKTEFGFDFWPNLQDQEGSLVAKHLESNVFIMPKKYRQISSWKILAKGYLTPEEKEVYDALFIGNQIPWLLGRIASKDAVRYFLNRLGNLRIHPGLFQIKNESSGKPILAGKLLPAELHTSIAHKKEVGVGICSKQPVGIDIEHIEERSLSFAEEMLNPSEFQLFKELGSSAGLLTKMWVAKEAYGKLLGTGLQGHPKSFTVLEIKEDRLRIKEQWIKTITYNKYIIGWTI